MFVHKLYLDLYQTSSSMISWFGKISLLGYHPIFIFSYTQFLCFLDDRAVPEIFVLISLSYVRWIYYAWAIQFSTAKIHAHLRSGLGVCDNMHGIGLQRTPRWVKRRCRSLLESRSRLDLAKLENIAYIPSLLNLQWHEGLLALVGDDQLVHWCFIYI